jgi:hypothetical protein
VDRVADQPVRGRLRDGRTGDRARSPDGQRHRAAVGERTQASHQPVIGEGRRVDAVREIAQVSERRADGPPRREIGLGLPDARVIGG